MGLSIHYWLVLGLHPLFKVSPNGGNDIAKLLGNCGLKHWEKLEFIFSIL